jgi:hypothetical protein
MKKIIFICLVAFTFCSCGSDEVSNQFDFDVIIDINITNAKGEDLLDPKNTNSFDQSKIKIFYLIDGKLVEVYDGLKTHPRNFLVYEREGHYVLRVFLNHSGAEKYPETRIQWNENSTDIIKGEFTRTVNAVIKKTIWFNDVAVTDYEPYLKITK